MPAPSLNGDSQSAAGAEEAPYVSSVYFDPNNLCSTTKVKALYNYKPKRTDELNLVKDLNISTEDSLAYPTNI